MVWIWCGNEAPKVNAAHDIALQNPTFPDTPAARLSEEKLDRQERQVKGRPAFTLTLLATLAVQSPFPSQRGVKPGPLPEITGNYRFRRIVSMGQARGWAPSHGAAGNDPSLLTRSL